MVADVLSGLARFADDSIYYDALELSMNGERANDNERHVGQEPAVFVRGSVLDAFAAHDRVARLPASSHIAAVDSDDNGLYRLYHAR